ncbi:unnamed protein product [Dibothriocephalus latus]|uniref:Uncharacterized protein n=1 Tax=Dibothriocephalus latus TaxID=60516 RepID=A0A3P7MQZ1_DIBLA|nr:unnamed protein product [Dibothriocephalus latus]
MFAIRWGFAHIDEKVFRKTYRAFARSHLEYAVQAWRPWFKKYYLHLERVQAGATQMIKNPGPLPYQVRLAELDLFALDDRQLHGDPIRTYRIVRDRECVLKFDGFFELARADQLLGRPFKLLRCVSSGSLQLAHTYR